MTHNRLASAATLFDVFNIARNESGSIEVRVCVVRAIRAWLIISTVDAGSGENTDFIAVDVESEGAEALVDKVGLNGQSHCVSISVDGELGVRTRLEGVCCFGSRRRR